MKYALCCMYRENTLTFSNSTISPKISCTNLILLPIKKLCLIWNFNSNSKSNAEHFHETFAWFVILVKLKSNCRALSRKKKNSGWHLTTVAHLKNVLFKVRCNYKQLPACRTIKQLAVIISGSRFSVRFVFYIKVINAKSDIKMWIWQ